jgi:GAF domain-containing protein
LSEYPGLLSDVEESSLSLDPAATDALLRATREVLAFTSFEETARAIFDEACAITGAISGYVALMSEDGSENEVLFLEAGGLPCLVDRELPMPIRGLREVAYRTCEPAYDNDFMNSDWVKYMAEGHVVLRNVLFSPLVIDGRAAGVMGLANKDGDFNERDAAVAKALGELAALALRHSQTLDELRDVNTSLRQALDEVKTLRGILPICSGCKKIRDEKGYWHQVETYIHDHSDADFTHSLCEECVTEYYPELAES